VGTLSIPGSTSCRPLGNCTEADFIEHIEPLSSCAEMPELGPGRFRDVSRRLRYVADPDGILHHPLCAIPPPFASEQEYAAQMETLGPSLCSCPKGMGFAGAGATSTCSFCPAGTFNRGLLEAAGSGGGSDGGDGPPTATEYVEECQPCAEGTRSVPGRYFEDWADDEIVTLSTIEVNGDDDAAGGGLTASNLCVAANTKGTKMCTTCIGAPCDPMDDLGGWVASRNFLSSGKTFGDVDTVFVIQNLNAAPGAHVAVTCSVDCRMHSIGGKLARADVCQLTIRLVNSTGGTPSGLTIDCGTDHDTGGASSWYLSADRQGLPMTKTLTLPDQPDDWHLVATFRQREEKVGAMFESYEGRLHSVYIDHANEGGAAECQPCPLGTKQGQPPSQACQECGLAMQSNVDDRYACESCPAGTFSNHEAKQCTPCGNNTVVSSSKQGCDAGPKGRCKFGGEASGRSYDLNGLGAIGSEMVFAGAESSFKYWLNPCSTEHAANACVDPQNKSLPYMACQVVEHENGKHEVLDLGDTYGYYEEEEGKVQMEFHDYTSECTRYSGWGMYRTEEKTWRQAKITLSCADVGRGVPRALSYWRGIESET
jgi:hypothetical protein